jgi:hypothetical protein
MSKKILVVQPFNQESDTVYSFIQSAVNKTSEDLQVSRSDEMLTRLSIVDSTYDALETSDLIIFDVSESNSSVMYELGYAHGFKKPVILISRKSHRYPFDVRNTRTFFYELDWFRSKSASLIAFIKQLSIAIQEALDDPSTFSHRPSVDTSINSVFISYSHEDEEYLDRLMVHLRPLEKGGLIDMWADTKLKAGDRWKQEIQKALHRARVAILLISADFLASDFIIDNELPPILRNAESEGTHIIPIILKPCRFTRDENLSEFHAINDPKRPLSMRTASEREVIFDKVSETVESFLI